MKERSQIFETMTLSEGFFIGPNKVNCAAPYSESFLSKVGYTVLTVPKAGGEE